MVVEERFNVGSDAAPATKVPIELIPVAVMLFELVLTAVLIEVQGVDPV
jgi:hypothetical protein